jgi:hypothetical protein
MRSTRLNQQCSLTFSLSFCFCASLFLLLFVCVFLCLFVCLCVCSTGVVISPMEQLSPNNSRNQESSPPLATRNFNRTLSTTTRMITPQLQVLTSSSRPCPPRTQTSESLNRCSLPVTQVTGLLTLTAHYASSVVYNRPLVLKQQTLGL